MEQRINGKDSKNNPLALKYGVPSGGTAFFRAANFELFVKPNKYIMTAGLITFSMCLAYFYRWNRKARNESNGETYVAINEDNTSIRQRKSRWD